jgi:teichuronic acid exporter
MAQNKSFLFSFLQLFSNQFVSIILLIFLTRLLTPEDFGIVALTTIFIQIAQVVIDFGYSHSIIRNQIDNTKELSSILFFSFFISILIYIVFYSIAPIFAVYFNNVVFTKVLRLQSISLFFFAFSNFYNNLMSKESKFKIQFIVSFTSILIAAIFSFFLAYKKYGFWSIVSFSILQPFINFILYFFIHEWKPILYFNYSTIKYHFNYCKYLTLSGTLDIIYNNLNQIIIGKFFSLSFLGFYNRADSLKQLPVANITQAINKVSYPILSKNVNNIFFLKQTYKNLLKISSIVLLPLLIFFIIYSDDIFMILFTEKWIKASAIFQILCISSFFYPIHVFNLNVLTLLGKSNYFFNLEVTKKTIGIVIVLISVNYGVIGLAWSQVIASFIFVFFNSYYSKKLIDYSIYEQFYDLLPIFFISFLLFLFLYFFNNHFFLLKQFINMKLFFGFIFFISFYFFLYYLNSKIVYFKSIFHD